MVKLDRIYTRGGDEGETSLTDGARVRKDHLRVAAYGTVDEINAAIGVARLHTLANVDGMLETVQHDLFDLGADLSTPLADAEQALRITAKQVDRLEKEIDAMNARLAPLHSFVLPGGSPAAAYLHLARTITRRAEREVTALRAAEAINPEALRYLNRLSDHLFVMSRCCNHYGHQDVLWVPGHSRV